MVDFASIYGIANRPTTALQTPMEAMGQALQLKSAMQQGELQGLNLQQQKQATADAEAVRKIAVESGGDPDALYTGLMKAGKVQDAQKIRLGQMESAKAEREAKKAQIELLNGFTQRQAAILGSVKDQASWDMAQKQMEKEAQAMGLDTSTNDHPPVYDPVWVQNKLAQMQTIDQKLKVVAQALDAEKAAEQARHNRATESNTRRGQDMGVGIYAGTPLAPGGRPAVAPGAPAPQGGQPTATVNDRLAMLPDGVRELVRQIGTYQMLPSQVSPRQKTAVMNMVAQVFPNYSIADAEANQKFVKSLASDSPGSAGGVVAASERLLGHVGELADLIDKLGNSSFGKLGNVVGGFIDTTTGTGKAGEIKAFELTKGKVIAELNKLANGGVPHADEMKHDIEQLKYTDPPEVKYQVLKSAVTLGLEQTHAKEQQRDNLLGEFSPRTSLLSERAQGVAKRVFKNAGGEAPDLAAPTTGRGYTTTANAKPTNPATAAPTQGTAKQLTPAEIGKLPPDIAQAYLEGKTIQGPDGTSYKKGK